MNEKQEKKKEDKVIQLHKEIDKLRNNVYNKYNQLLEFYGNGDIKKIRRSKNIDIRISSGMKNVKTILDNSPFSEKKLNDAISLLNPLIKQMEVDKKKKEEDEAKQKEQSNELEDELEKIKLDPEAIKKVREKQAKQNQYTQLELYTLKKDKKESLLREAGKAKREEIKQAILEKHPNKPVSNVSLNPRQVTDILEKHFKFAVLADDDGEFENVPLYFYDAESGLYKHSDSFIKAYINMVDNNISINGQKEILNKLRTEAFQNHKLTKNHNTNLIPMINGIYDKTKHELIDFDPKHVFTTKINIIYDDKATTEPIYNNGQWSISKWFNEIANGDKEKLTLLWQTIAAAINFNQNIKTAVILLDGSPLQNGSNGKSTFEDLLRNIVGETSTASIQIREFTIDKVLVNIVDKALVVGDDNDPDSFIESSANFKRVITGDPINISPMYKQSFPYRFKGLVVQSANGMPRFKDHTNALFRRFRVIKFTKIYQENAQNKRIKAEYIKDHQLLSWLFNKAIKYDISDGLINTQESIDVLNENKEESDPVLSFANEYMDDFKSTRIPTKILFNYFLVCMKKENRPSRISQNEFTRRIKPILEDKGWRYYKKTKTPTKYWNNEDNALLSKFSALKDTQEIFDFKVDPSKQQPLFAKE